MPAYYHETLISVVRQHISDYRKEHNESPSAIILGVPFYYGLIDECGRGEIQLDTEGTKFNGIPLQSDWDKTDYSIRLQ